MTLASSTTQVTYTGNGSANSFSFPFLVFSQTHLAITISSPANPPVNYTLTLGTDFTVSGLSPVGNPAFPGSITLVNRGQLWLTGGALTSGWTINIQRVVPLEQNYSIRNQGDFYREYLENALDYLTMEVQQLQTEIAALQVSGGGGGGGSATSLVLTDQITGIQYNVIMYNGVLSVQQV